jgi:hypothetical protein
MQDHIPDGYYMVADSAFPRLPNDVANKIQKPIKTGAILPSNQHEREELLAFTRQLVSYRQTAEWGMRTLQGSFGRLRVPLPIADDQARQDLIETCVRLNNLRATRVGISQIKAVYEPTWRESEDDNLWDNLGDVIFRDIRANDRVRRFHLEVEEIER